MIQSARARSPHCRGARFAHACAPALGVLLAAVATGCGATTPSSGGSGRGGSTSSGGQQSTSGGASSGATAGLSAGAGQSSGGASGSTAAAGSGGSTGVAGGGGAGGASSNGGGSGSAGASAGGGAGLGCAGKNYKLCEDFESGTVGGVPTGWTALKGYGTAAGVGLANDQFRSGSMALKSDSMTPGQSRVQKSLAALGATATNHWGRLFYKVQSPAPRPAANNVIHVTFAALEGTTENRIVDTVEASNGTHQFLFNIPDDSCCTSSTYDWTFDDAWHCAEWHIDVTAESYQFFSDGKEVTSLAFTGKANAKMSTYSTIALGTIFYQMPPSPFVVWFDDLAIDDTQIGCQ